MSVYNRKDIIRMNQEIGESGDFSNESSLTFSLNMLKERKDWLYELSYLVRSLLVDHVFVDGNKRTAFMLASLYFEYNKREYDDQKLVNTVLKISKKGITDINEISRELRKC